MATHSGFSRKAKAFYATNRFVRRLYSFGLAIHQGFWLGVFDKKSLSNLVNASYEDWSGYHQRDYLHSGLWPWEKASIEKYFNQCHTILIGGAGAGREIIALSKMEYQVDGFDCSRSLAKTAAEILSLANIENRYEISEPDHVPTTFGVYDGLILGWSAYSHIIGQESRIQFLKEFRQHVDNGSPVLISFFTYDKKSLMFSTIYCVANAIRLLLFRKERIEYGDTLVETYLHHTNQANVEQELRLAGFALKHYSDHGFGHAVALAI